MDKGMNKADPVRVKKVYNLWPSPIWGYYGLLVVLLLLIWDVCAGFPVAASIAERIAP